MVPTWFPPLCFRKKHEILSLWICRRPCFAIGASFDASVDAVASVVLDCLTAREHHPTHDVMPSVVFGPLPIDYLRERLALVLAVSVVVIDFDYVRAIERLRRATQKKDQKDNVHAAFPYPEELLLMSQIAI